ncbi:NAD-dependent epimerase/dehydratase family protein [candidate division KSB1 bacterium]
MSKALITGGTGFVGSHLAEFLIKNRFSVKCLVRKSSNRKWLADLPIDYCIGSLQDKSSLIEAVKDVDHIFHAGGLIKAKKRSDFFMVNHIGTENLLAAAESHCKNLKRFLYCSSQAAAGPSLSKKPVDENNLANPVSVYGESKYRGEESVLSYSGRMPVTIVRPPSIYGPRDEGFLFVFKMINKGISPILGTENKFYNFIYIDDLIKGIFNAAVSEKSINHVFFLCDDNIYSWGEVVGMIRKIIGKKVIKIRIPLPVLYTSALFSELAAKITGKPSVFNLQKIAELKEDYWVCTSQKAGNLLGFKPAFSIEQGLKITFDWYKKFGYI